MGAQIELKNDDTGDLFVTVNDLNLAGEPEIVKEKRINSENQDPVFIPVQLDGDNTYSIRWRARRVDGTGEPKQQELLREDDDPVYVTTRL